MTPEMSTSNRGSILSVGRGRTGSGVGMHDRGAYEEPAEFTTGDNCDVGLGDESALNPELGLDD